jgi:hypothetical protein
MYVFGADVFVVNEVEEEQFFGGERIDEPKRLYDIETRTERVICCVSLYKTKLQVMFFSG